MSGGPMSGAKSKKLLSFKISGNALLRSSYLSVFLFRKQAKDVSGDAFTAGLIVTQCGGKFPPVCWSRRTTNTRMCAVVGT